MRQKWLHAGRLFVHRVLTAWENAVLWLIEGAAWNQKWIPVRVRDSLNDQWWEIVDRQNDRYRRVEDLDARFGGEQQTFWSEETPGTITLEEEDDLLRRAIEWHRSNSRMYYDLAWSEDEEIERLYERLGEVQVDLNRVRQGMRPMYLPSANAELAAAAALGQPVVVTSHPPDDRWDEDDDEGHGYWWWGYDE